MEEDFRALLLADAGLSALVGDRVNYGAQTQGEPLPAVVLTVVSSFNGHTIYGPLSTTQARVQVDCYALSYGAAAKISRAVVVAIDGHRDANFQGVFLVSTRASREDTTERPYRYSLDFEVVHNS